MQVIDSRLELLRTIMRREQVDAWIVNGTDPHLSEYVASRWRTRAWISGFNGSAGTVVVTLDRALLWVDARYFVQAEMELKGSSFELQKLNTAQVDDHITWLSKNMPSGSRIGMDASTLTFLGKRTLQNGFLGKRLEVVSTTDWFDELWSDRPPVPNEPVSSMDIAIAGESRRDKLARVRSACAQMGCSHTIISSLDDIAWILNLRGQDVPYNPVFLSYLLIGHNEAWLFVQESRFEPSLLEELEKDVSVLPYASVFTQLGTLVGRDDTIYLSPDRTNMGIINALPLGITIKEGRDFSTDFKAAKSEHELEGMRRAHLLDGVAMVKLLCRLSTTAKEYDELSIAEELHTLRKEHPEYLGPSFNPIAGFREHGVLAHYAATKDSCSQITGDGLLVLDTGGQYLTGMTDITRTLLFGEASQEMKRDYTLVLKGNLSLAAQRFPEGTCGYQLDILARQHLWQYGLSYGHGTGHGVGFRLSVHEGPLNVSPRPVAVPLVPGMVLSDEPGVYKEGRYGVRIENLLAVRVEGTTEFGSFLSFEVLTICPFEKRLIAKEFLQPQEIRMIDSYHAWVYDELSTHLTEIEKGWLRSATSPLDE
jgi:Xaa-Pro aminopeptidase